jgi:hypothetical protein
MLRLLDLPRICSPTLSVDGANQPTSILSVDGANQQTMDYDQDSDEEFGFPSLTDSMLDVALWVLSPYQELEKKLADINSKAFQSNQHSGAFARRHYAGVDYSKQMLAMMAFKETEDCYYVDLEKLIEYHDPRNHCEFHCLLTFVSLTGLHSKVPRFLLGD